MSDSKKIIATMASKILILVCSFGTTTLTARLWGAEGRGLIALYIANISVTSIFTNILTNSSACYYLARTTAKRLWMLSVVWTLLVCAGTTFFFYGSSNPDAIDTEQSLLFFATCVLTGFCSFHHSIFIVKERIDYYNLATMLQSVLIFFFLVVVLLLFHTDSYAYFYVHLLAMGCIFLMCTKMRSNLKVDLGYQWHWSDLKDNIVFGAQEEMGEFLKFLGFRLPYYFLGYFCGLASVGVFSVGVALSEAVGIISRSFGLVQYSKLLQPGQENDLEAIRLTTRYAMVSLLVSTACIGIALLLPNVIYTTIFGDDYSNLKTIILWLSPGVLALSVSRVYAHYFSATGRLKALVVGPALGALLALVLSYALIAHLEWKGACIANTAAYLGTAAVQMIWYKVMVRKIVAGKPSASNSANNTSK